MEEFFLLYCKLILSIFLIFMHMRGLVCFITVLLLQITVAAQSPFGSSKQFFKKKLYYAELNGGGILSSMDYKKNQYDSYQSNPFLNKTFGLGLRVQFSNNLSFSSQLTYRTLGASFPKYDNMVLKANNLNLFVPFELDHFFEPVPNRVLPNAMFFAGPFVAYNIGGHIVSDKINQEMTSDEMLDYDYGLEAGLGLRIPTFSFTGKSFITVKASYFRGFANTLPSSIRHSEDQMKMLMLTNKGRRNSQGIRLTLSYELTLTKVEMTSFTAGGDGKKTYKRFVVKK